MAAPALQDTWRRWRSDLATAGVSWNLFSGVAVRTLSVARHVADLHEVVTSRCHNRPVALVGHSWGAMLALAYAAQHADRIASVVLIGPGTFTVEARERMRAILDARTDASLRQRVRMLDEECADSDERLGRRARLTLPLYSYDIGSSDPGFEACDARAHQETWDDMMRLQEIGVYPQAFETIRTPVVMLHGAVDPHPGEMIRASLEPYLPQLEYVEWERCGHYPWLEPAVRDDFFRVMIEWLHRHTDSSARMDLGPPGARNTGANGVTHER